MERSRTSRFWRRLLAPRPAHALIPALVIIVVAALLAMPSTVLAPWMHWVLLALLVVSVLLMQRAVRWSVALAEQLHIARADPLTGLPNRRAVHALESSSLEGAVLVSLDLDGLGEINAWHGTVVGDQVLVRVADRLRFAVRTGDTVARIGGDDFGLVLPATTVSEAERLTEVILQALEVEISASGATVQVSACAGISSQGGAAADAEHLLAEADAALKEAKALGSGIVRTFSGDTGGRSQDRLRMRAEIKEAFRSGGDGFLPYFHPITSVADGSIFAVESLVRWHRDGEVWGPGRFIPEVEQSGSMAALTEHMLHTSLAQLRGAGLQCPATVNVPPDLVNETLPSIVQAALHASRSLPSQLIVEITEDAIMRNPQLAARVLHELREGGVRVLLDDFGTGWSGLSSLRDLVVDGLKMDGSFINGIVSDFTTNSIVRSVADLAERLGLVVIYEGVEDPALLAEVDTFKDGFIQGFAISKPMPIADLSRWVRVRAVQEASKHAGDPDAPVKAIW